MVTSVGKLLFNKILPKDYTYINEPTDDNLQNGVPDKYFLDKGEDIHDYLENAPLVPPFKKGFLSDLIAEVYKRYKVTKTSQFLDRIKDLGYYESTISGLTTAMSDIHDLPDTLHNALKSLANDEVIKSSMGEHLYNSFMEAKTREYASYRQHVSDWERQHYMEQY